MDSKEIMDDQGINLLSDEELDELAKSSDDIETVRAALNSLRERESKHLNRRLNFLSDRIKTLLRKETQLSVVHSFGTALLTKHTVGAISWAVVRNLCHAMSWDNTSLYSLDNDGNMVLQAHVSKDSQSSAQDMPFAAPKELDKLVSIVLHTKAPVIAKNQEDFNRLTVGYENAKSAIAFPIMINDKLIGVFHSTSKDEDKYTNEHLSLFVSLSNILGAKLQEAQWNDQIKSNRAQLKSLVEERTNELKRAIDLLKEQNLEKDVLLKEVHHRVKNNMQIIISLLRLQTNNVEDNEATTIIQNSQNRIMAMAMIHEQLYNSDSLSHISAKNYITDLSVNLKLAYDMSESIVLEHDLDDVELDLEKLVPVGLIVNELLTNSLKHAFKIEQTNPTISISLRRGVSDQALLTIKDNGGGFDLDEFNQPNETLGFELVKSLAEQIDGDAKAESTHEGAKFAIRFKC